MNMYEEQFGSRDLKYSRWHRSLPHNHLLTDFDMFDLSEMNVFGIFSGKDSDNDDICKAVFETKEIVVLECGDYILPNLKKYHNQFQCLRSFSKRYDKTGQRNDIPCFVCFYSIVENEKFFVIYNLNDSSMDICEKTFNKKIKSLVVSENGYIKFLNNVIGKQIYKSGSSWMPEKKKVRYKNFLKDIV